MGVALGGTSVAAIQALPKNSVGTKQLKSNAVTSPKVKDNGITGADVNEASLGQVPSAANATSATNATNAANAANAANATNSANLGGVAASAYTKAGDFAYGEIDPNGAVKASPPNKNIISVTRPLTGVYCVDLAFTPTFAEGSATGASGVGLNVQPDIPATNCPAGTDATVYLISNANAFINDDFQVLFGAF
ncbi:MAG TPA: hypothetical protein VKC65_07810 [Gaiellaceae bacterium]|nr:hypothetical protein [Gaiellaceae bacterium]